MLQKNISTESTPMEKRRIHISSKRQITIPVKYYEALGLDKELECIYSNDMLILTPVKKEDNPFAEEILADLIAQGYFGEQLLSKFKEMNRKIRPAVQKMIEEADKLATSSLENYTDPTNDIFGNDEGDA
jgi:bifunctional DNA-binding transcriptional regulator/antitoxin component of YhaV-PrlF toxin-antitoxin module